jgi:hypothetical protein
MSNEVEFVNGLIAKAPHERAPAYVKAKLSIKREELIEWLESREDEWINADIKVSQGGKWYVAVDSWRPEQRGSGRSERQAPAQRSSGGASDPTDDIPFLAPITRRNWSALS